MVSDIEAKLALSRQVKALKQRVADLEADREAVAKERDILSDRLQIISRLVTALGRAIT